MMNEDILDFEEENIDLTKNIASKGTRFGNLFLDQLFFGIPSSLLVNFLIYGDLAGDPSSPEEAIINPLISWLLYVGYYIFMESVYGKTIGKMITGTKVIDENGGKPSLGQIVGRSFARLIPFEAFSFLGEKGIGWHDSLSKTLVIKE